jgi:hypothetical protein
MMKKRKKIILWCQTNGLKSSRSILSFPVIFCALNVIEKPGKGIFLMKQRAKLMKAKKQKKQYEIKRSIAPA